jgi:quinol-cytochrome oxidoreductase complex cytochrome b subunit
VVLAESYTGYLLPWDQLSYWAVEIGSRLMAAVPWIGESLRRAILGGDDIGRAALVRFYALHVVILPAAILFLLLVHLWRVRQNGGLAHRSENEGAPPVGEPATVPAWPHLVLRETAVALACLAIVLAMALALGAPLGEPADPAHAPRPAKAAWYFLWLQELVSYDYGPLTRVHWPPWDSSGPTLGSEFWGGVLVPTLCAAALLILPYASSRRRGVGLYFARERRAACIAFAIVMAAIIALILVGNFLRGPDWRFVWPF